MGVSALLGNCINYGFLVSVFPKPTVSGPGREKRDVCDLTKWEPWWRQLHQSAGWLRGLGCNWRPWAWQTLRATSYPWQRSSASCFGKLRHSRSFQKTSQLRGIPVLGMGEQSCAGLGGTGTPGLGVLVCSYRVFHMVWQGKSLIKGHTFQRVVFFLPVCWCFPKGNVLLK